MDDVAVDADVEIVEEPAVAGAGLGADAGTAGGEVFGLDVGDEAPEGADEGGLAEGTMEFAEAGAPVLAGDDAEPRPGERFPGVAEAEIGLAIGFAGEGEDGVGTAFDAPLDHPGEMDAEERKGGVGDGVDEMSDQAAGFGPNVVFAPERATRTGRSG